MIIPERVRYRLLVSAGRVSESRLPIKMALGRAVRRLRVAAGYSEEQFGARVGLRPVDVTALECGEQNISLATLERLAGALGMRVSALLREAERNTWP